MDINLDIEFKAGLKGDGKDLTGLTKAQVGLSEVDNTPDSEKPTTFAVYDLIASEAALRTDADGIETAQRIAQDNTLNGLIAGESNLRVAADNALAATISTEVTARQTGDASLNTLISNEVTARTAADATLNTAIVNEIAARVAAIAGIPAAVWTKTALEAYLTGVNVGIGTVSPAAKLEILETVLEQLRLSYSATVWAGLYVDSVGKIFLNTSVSGGAVVVMGGLSPQVGTSLTNIRYVGGSRLEFNPNGTTGQMILQATGQLQVKSNTSQFLLTYPASGNSATIGMINTNVELDTSNAAGTYLFKKPVVSTQYKLSALNTAPTSATATGALGEIRITASFIYVCVATNTWVRSALTTW